MRLFTLMQAVPAAFAGFDVLGEHHELYAELATVATIFATEQAAEQERERLRAARESHHGK